MTSKRQQKSSRLDTMAKIATIDTAVKSNNMNSLVLTVCQCAVLVSIQVRARSLARSMLNTNTNTANILTILARFTFAIRNIYDANKCYVCSTEQAIFVVVMVRARVSVNKLHFCFVFLLLFPFSLCVCLCLCASFVVSRAHFIQTLPCHLHSENFNSTCI